MLDREFQRQTGEKLDKLRELLEAPCKDERMWKKLRTIVNSYAGTKHEIAYYKLSTLMDKIESEEKD